MCRPPLLFIFCLLVELKTNWILWPFPSDASTQLICIQPKKQNRYLLIFENFHTQPYLGLSCQLNLKLTNRNNEPHPNFPPICDLSIFRNFLKSKGLIFWEFRKTSISAVFFLNLSHILTYEINQGHCNNLHEH